MLEDFDADSQDAEKRHMLQCACNIVLQSERYHNEHDGDRYWEIYGVRSKHAVQKVPTAEVLVECLSKLGDLLRALGCTRYISGDIPAPAMTALCSRLTLANFHTFKTG